MTPSQWERFTREQAEIDEEQRREDASGLRAFGGCILGIVRLAIGFGLFVGAIWIAIVILRSMGAM